MPNTHIGWLDETSLFGWLQVIRDSQTSQERRSCAEIMINDSLMPIALGIAKFFSSTRNYDAEQVANDAIDILIEKYLRDTSVSIPTCGHLVSLLHRITLNTRNQALRRANQRKRSPQDLDGNLLSIASIDVGNCTCHANTQDPACICEEKERFERCIQALSAPVFQQVFVMLYANYTRKEIAVALDLEPEIIRIHIRKVRRILESEISYLQPPISKPAPE